MTQPLFKMLPLSALHISKKNMRHGRKKPLIDDILPTIRARGLLQNLLVTKEQDGYGVVAGRRRWFALQAIAKETDSADALIPCLILSANDDAAAIEASLIENFARLPASEMEQFVAFAKVEKAGRSVTDIAQYFGVTELYAKRVLALGNLIAPIRKLYANEDMSVGTVRALTLATHSKQKEWYGIYRDNPRNAPTENACRNWITGGQCISSEYALFDIKDYKGEILSDLFGKNKVFEDSVAFWAMQSKAIAKCVAAYIEKGWSEVHVMDRGKYFSAWEYEKVAKSKGGHVYVQLSHNGEVTFNEGYLTKKQAKKLANKSGEGTSKTVNVVKPEMSGPLSEYIGLHRHHATRAHLLDFPSVAFRLFVAHVIAGSNNWNVASHDYVAKKPDTEASIEMSIAEKKMTENLAELCDLLESVDVNLSEQKPLAVKTVEVFIGLLRLSDESVMKIATYSMADTLEWGGPVVEAVAHVTNLDMSKYWKVDDTCLDLIRDKRVLNAMIGELAGKSKAQSQLAQTAKVQRQTIKNRISGQGCKAQSDWSPRWMATPPQSYLKGAACAPEDAWKKVADLVEKGGKDKSAKDAA